MYGTLNDKMSNYLNDKMSNYSKTYEDKVTKLFNNIIIISENILHKDKLDEKIREKCLDKLNSLKYNSLKKFIDDSNKEENFFNKYIRILKQIYIAITSNRLVPFTILYNYNIPSEALNGAIECSDLICELFSL